MKLYKHKLFFFIRIYHHAVLILGFIYNLPSHAAARFRNIKVGLVTRFLTDPRMCL